tara:strand:- start:258 stop:653 length:396 start_codon:yes stop_codon:yes gene_type:complete
MFNITKTIEYALIALRHINNGDGKVATSKDIALLYNIPKELLAKILQKLCKKGYLKAIQGPHGGYLLGKNLSDINLIDFIESMEGPIGVTKCSIDMDCNLLDMCNIKQPIYKINESIRSTLSKISLHELTI